jgi:hypothetical protein
MKILYGLILFFTINHCFGQNLKEGDIQHLSRKNSNSFFLASDRYSDDNKIEIFKLVTLSQNLSPVIIQGNFEVLNYPKYKKAQIKVYNASDESFIGEFNTNPYTGKYILVLAPNIKYIFKIHVPNFSLVEELVEIPLKINLEVCLQNMLLDISNPLSPSVKINNIFTLDNNKINILDFKGQELEENEELFFLPVSNKNKGNETPSNINELVKKQNEIEKRKPIEARAAFNNKEFKKASILYAELLKNDPEDPFVNYFYGVSLFQTEKQKIKCIPNLQRATVANENPYDVWFFLGQAYHLSYMFKEGIEAFTNYKSKCTNEERIKNSVDLMIGYCENGLKFMNNQSQIEVESRLLVDHKYLFYYYNSSLINDKVMFKTDFFISPIDKKNKETLLMCKSGQSEIIQVSYGLSDKNSKDLYSNKNIGNGSYGYPESLGEHINTPYDEDFPYLSEDRKTLYFSSKGHNSMGGYDIFKCTRPDINSPWSKPINLGYPINSPYDDILYVTDSIGNYASFSSNRRDPEKFEVFNIKIPKNQSSISIIKGNFTTTDESKIKEAIISVYHIDDGEVAGIYLTNSKNGNYVMALPSGMKYEIYVNCEGYPEFNETLEIPEIVSNFTLKQELKIVKLNDDYQLKINNYFTPQEAANVLLDEPKAIKNEPITKEEKKLVLSKPSRSAAEVINDNEKIKQAHSFAEQKKYQEAYKILLELDKVIDFDPLTSYYFGKCVVILNKNKLPAINHLELAVTSSKVPHDALFYLGKAYQNSYRFSSAIKAFETFKSLAKSSESESLNIDNEIQLCINGKNIIDSPSVIEILKRSSVEPEQLYSLYSGIESGAKILQTPDDLKSPLDKKKNFKSSLFLSADKSIILYSSYGISENNKDIYSIKKLPTGDWSEPVKLPVINTEYDEEFPFLSNCGQKLYFSSKGHSSIGGYDVFMSTWDEKNNIWSSPVNLGVPINSIYDDILFVE